MTDKELLKCKAVALLTASSWRIGGDKDQYSDEEWAELCDAYYEFMTDQLFTAILKRNTLR